MMSELRIKTAIDNGDLPEDWEQLDLFKDQEPKQISLFDIFTPERLKEFLKERDNKQFSYAPYYEKRALTKGPLYPIKLG